MNILKNLPLFYFHIILKCQAKFNVNLSKINLKMILYNSPRKPSYAPRIEALGHQRSLATQLGAKSILGPFPGLWTK